MSRHLAHDVQRRFAAALIGILALTSFAPTWAESRSNEGTTERPYAAPPPAQVTVNASAYGIWSYGSFKNDHALDAFASGGVALSGHHLTLDWKDLQPSKPKGTDSIFENAFDNALDHGFDWRALDGKLDQLDLQKGDGTQGLRYSVIIMTGSGAPDWAKDDAGWFTIKNHPKDNEYVYPFYFAPDYKSAYWGMLESVARHMNGYPVARLKRLVGWQITEGSTGDAQPYKGEMYQCFTGSQTAPIEVNCTDWRTQLDNQDLWTSFRHTSWDIAYAWSKIRDASKPPLRLMFNPGNNGEDLDHVVEHYQAPGADYKVGALAHLISFDNEAAYARRKIALAEKREAIHALPDDFRTRAEAQNLDLYTSWNKSPAKLTLVLMQSALAGGLDMLNWTSPITPGVARALAFYNKYAEFREASSTNGATRGFSALREVLDIASTERYPESAPYGPVIGDQNGYDRRMTQQAQRYGEQPLYLDYLNGQAKVDFINVARQTQIKLAAPVDFPGASATIDPNADAFHRYDALGYDYGVEMMANYERFVTQIDPAITTVPRWRVGAQIGSAGDSRDDDLFGRYARQFKSTGAAGAMYFQVDSGLGGISGKNKSIITIQYYDQGVSTWMIRAGTSTQRITNGPKNGETQWTPHWASASIVVDDFKFDHSLARASDIIITLTSGEAFPIALVEFENTSKNQ